MISKFLSLIIFFIFCSPSGASIGLFVSTNTLNRCINIFKQAPSEPIVFSKQKNPYSKALDVSVYQQISLLEGVLSKKELQYYTASLVKTIQQFENGSHKLSDAAFQTRINLMNSNLKSRQLLTAIRTFPKMVQFAQSKEAHRYEFLDTNRILKLVLSTFSQHILSYLTHPVNKLDWARFNYIVNSIAEFNRSPDIFSLYKIQRAIKEKYSLREYLNCK